MSLTPEAVLGLTLVTFQPLLIFLGAFAGLIAGSFVGALVTRWPRGLSVAHGRSACDACGRTLSPRELVPVLSYALQRGRCRACGAPIPPVHLAVELGCALVGATAFAATPPLVALAGLLFGWTLVALALLDAGHFWLPDRLTIGLALTGMAASLAGLGPPPRTAAIGLAVGFGSLWLIGFTYRQIRGRTGLGGGDPKLFAGIGAWVGWPMLPFVLLLASLAGLAAIAARALGGTPMAATDKLPLGTLLAVAAWPVWLLVAGGRGL